MTPSPTQRKRRPRQLRGGKGRSFKGKGVWALSKSSKYETKHGIRRVGSEGMLNFANNNRKGDVGNNNKGIMNRDVFACLCTGKRRGGQGPRGMMPADTKHQ